MLEAHEVSFGYAGAAPLYRGFNLSVAPGERVALSAPSGFGKTTLCRLLAGYEKPQAGNVLVDGEPLPERGASPVQLILQHPELAVDPRMRMADTLLEGMAGERGASAGAGAGLDAGVSASADLASASGRRPSRRSLFRRAGSAERVLADPEMNRLMEGLGIQRRWLSRFPHELSGGELQRFCLARALAAHPRYLVADEISTMLDALTQAQIWGFLLEEVEREGMGLVFVSHSPALVERIATRVVDLAG